MWQHIAYTLYDLFSGDFNLTVVNLVSITKLKPHHIYTVGTYGFLSIQVFRISNLKPANSVFEPTIWLTNNSTYVYGIVTWHRFMTNDCSRESLCAQVLRFALLSDIYTHMYVTIEYFPYTLGQVSNLLKL